ncbi:miraculin-like protein [Tanacetum coccineum]
MPVAKDEENGGLLFLEVGNFTCPTGVAQRRTGENGDPLTFTPINPKKGVICLSTDVNIKFLGQSICHESNVWRFNYDKNIKQYVVMLGGVEGNLRPETLDNWFKIEKTKDGYKFVFCPSVCSTYKVMCKDLGMVCGLNGMQRLAVREDPLSVNFYKNV